MMKLLYKICLLALMMPSSIFAQTRSDSLENDSLVKLLQNSKSSITGVNIYIRLGNNAFGNADLANAETYADTAIDRSRKLNFSKGEIAGTQLAAKILMREQNYSEAQRKYQHILDLSNQTKDSADRMIAYLGEARCQMGPDNYAGILQYAFMGLRLAEKLHDKKNMTACDLLIGFAHFGLLQYADAIGYYQTALRLAKEIGDNTDAGEACDKLGDIFYQQKRYGEAMEQYPVALKYFIKAGFSMGIANTLEGIADVNTQEGMAADSIGDRQKAQTKYEAALHNYLDGLQIMQAAHAPSEVAIDYRYIADLYLRLKKPQEAKIYLGKGLPLALASGTKGYIASMYEGLFALDSTLKDYKKAFADYKMYIIYRDSLLSEDNVRKATTYKMQYEFDKKEAAAKAAQDKKDTESKRIRLQQYFAIAGLALVMLAVMIIATIQFRNNRNKQKANLLLQQQKERVEVTLSELKSAQAQLIQSEKMASLGELTAGIAHEIQNPLNFVNNFSELNKELIDEASEENDKGNRSEVKIILNDIRDNEQKINHHGRRADSIVKGMLQHSRSSTGVKEFTDVNVLANEYLNLAYHGMRAKDKEFNTEIKTSFDPGIEKIHIIPQDIGRVLLNLYNNAFYATTEKAKQQPGRHHPVVSVSTKKVNNKVMLTVKDNGNGMKTAIIDKIFQPFFTTKPTGEGTGLGLSLSYDIIKAHGGEIKVKTKEDEGSEFIIQLPA